MRARIEIYNQLFCLATLLDESGEDKAASNIRLAIERLTYLQNGTPKQ